MESPSETSWDEPLFELPPEVTVLHGRFGDGRDTSVPAFCGVGHSEDGPRYAVNLDHPNANSSMVTCPECLEWIHA